MSEETLCEARGEICMGCPYTQDCYKEEHSVKECYECNPVEEEQEEESWERYW